MSRVRLQGVSQSYRGVKALDDVTVEVASQRLTVQVWLRPDVARARAKEWLEYAGFRVVAGLFASVAAAMGPGHLWNCAGRTGRAIRAAEEQPRRGDRRHPRAILDSWPGRGQP